MYYRVNCVCERAFSFQVLSQLDCLLRTHPDQECLVFTPSLFSSRASVGRERKHSLARVSAKVAQKGTCLADAVLNVLVLVPVGAVATECHSRFLCLRTGDTSSISAKTYSTKQTPLLEITPMQTHRRDRADGHLGRAGVDRAHRRRRVRRAAVMVWVWRLHKRVLGSRARRPVEALRSIRRAARVGPSVSATAQGLALTASTCSRTVRHRHRLWDRH